MERLCKRFRCEKPVHSKRDDFCSECYQEYIATLDPRLILRNIQDGEKEIVETLKELEIILNEEDTPGGIAGNK